MPSATNERLIDHSLFFSLLSGEFVIQDGEYFHCYTLGRLATVALQMGDEIPSLDSDSSTEYYYRPKWAPNILAMAIFTIDSEDQTHSELSELTLHAPSKRLILLDTESSLRPDLPDAVMIAPTIRRLYDIVTNEDLVRARIDIAAATYNFIHEQDD